MITSWDARALCAAAGVIILATMTTADIDTATDVQQMAAPTIRPTQREIILQSGENFTLYCSGTSQIQFKQQDIPEEVTSDFHTKQRIVKENETGYEVALDLVNVDRFAVGYYACFDNSVDAPGVLADIVEEPHDTPHISYIYIYVNGTIDMLAPMRSLLIPKGNSTFLIECRPTAPDIKVSLEVDIADVKYDHYSPKVGFIVGSDVLSDASTSIFICVFERQGVIFNKDVIVFKNKMAPAPRPEVSGGSKYFLEGETLSVNCTVKRPMNSGVELVWNIPNPNATVIYKSNENETSGRTLYKNLTIRYANKMDEGRYECISKNVIGTQNTSIWKKYLKHPKIEFIKTNTDSPIVKKLNGPVLKVAVDVDAYPPATFQFLKDNKSLPESSNPFKVKLNPFTKGPKIYLTLKNWKINLTGNYTVVATNQNLTNSSTFDVRVSAAPSVSLRSVKKYLLNTKSSLICEATGYPLPNIEWMFAEKDSAPVYINRTYQHDRVKSLYETESVLEIPVRVPGNITCKASNENKESSSVTADFIVYEIEDGFGIIKDHTWFPENQDVELKCLASIFDFSKPTWYGPDLRQIENVEHTENNLSHVAKVKLSRISTSQAGSYTCIGLSLDRTEERNDTITITVAENRPPVIEDMIEDGRSEEILPFHPVNFTCNANAIPPPSIEWFKDGKPVQNGTNMEVFTNSVDHSTRYSIIKILPNEDEAGKYECRVTSSDHVQSKIYNLLIKEKPSHKKTYLSIIGAIFLVLILVVAYLAWKIRKEKEFKNELRAAGLLNFKEGAIKSINRDIGIEEQAELLPYDEKFEFPAECLKLGKQLGAGAFGVVYKAEARGIIDAEKTTTVAVKMVKKTADNMYIKALATELKIMVHLGKHVNIVNLLGACTKNVGKRELIVIVEYCKFGNIQNYMQKHRDVFIDQLNDNPEKHQGKINRGYSSSSGNSGMYSDYYGSNNTQNTDHTLLNTANTNRSSRKHSETGYVQPEWRSNYESDYSFDGRSPRPLYTRDLLAWAFQIARGMEYLANRKVLHGDLAARNVLLAEDNVVKICDFGLARSIYKNDEYQKQENSPLPVKWLAIECMTDRIFSTQSDVWSFGIVLWELFSLAKTPYPNVSPPSLLQWLLQGERLEKPVYADDRIYELMRSCWEQKPTKRPSFTELQTKLGTFLEDNVRNHYVELDAAYMDMNTKKPGEEDYLAMVTAPDYNNLVTPSPHHYVNDAKSFFPPTPNQIAEDEGYLQMSPATRQNICNARPQGTKFDFDARKLSPKMSEANSYGSESTPMLTLNNLPRSGSESDQEGQSPPYHSVCPRIEEETDEVFETKLNHKNMQPNSITNPTYITMSADNDKKSYNFTNNYINVPNGLVK